MANREDFVTKLRAVTTQIIEGVGESNEVLQHYLSQGYSAEANFNDEHLQAVHPDITRADVLAAVGSLDALNTFLAGGHRTNLERIRRIA